jgi:hypothetical protein
MTRQGSEPGAGRYRECGRHRERDRRQSGAGTSRLDAEEMVAAACAATGLEHFGEPDPRVSLQELVRSLNDEAQLTVAGVAGKRASLIRVLANRLLLQHAFDSNAALARETIRAPIVILGLPRSGTTKLHRMIAADPIMQKLPLWRLLYPVRALAPAATAEDPRIAAARQFVDVLRQRSPDTYAAHPMDALEPDEEYFGMELSFLSNLNTSSFHTSGVRTLARRGRHSTAGMRGSRAAQYTPALGACIGSALGSQGAAPSRLSAAAVRAVSGHDDRALPPRPRHGRRVVLCIAAGVAPLDELARRSAGDRTVRDAHLRHAHAALFARPRRSRESRTVHRRGLRRDRNAAPDVIARCYAAAGLDLRASSLQEMQSWEARTSSTRHGRHQYALAISVCRRVRADSVQRLSRALPALSLTAGAAT